MKPIGVISTAVLLLLIGTNAPTHAQQQDQQEKDRQKQQQDQNRQRDQDREQQQGHRQQQQDQSRQRDQDREQRAQQQKEEKDKQKQDKQKQQRDQNSEQQRAQQQQEKGEQREQKPQRQVVDERSRSDQEQPGRDSAQRDAWQQHRAKNWHFEHRTWQDRGGYSGYRIPDDQFRDNFGENHLFRIYNRPVVVVGGYPRFQYGGYWFSVVDPWPEYWSNDWYDRDEVYIAYLDDGYYLYDRRYPGDRIAVSVYLN